MPRTTISLVRQSNYVGDTISAINNTQIIENRIVQQNAETNAQAAARAEYDINVTIEQGSNFYFLTYNGIYDDNFIDYRKGIKFFNKFLCKKTFFNSDTIQYDDYYFNNSFENVINEITEEYFGIEENKIASMICFNLQDVYKLLTSTLYLDDSINPDNNIGEPNLTIFNTGMQENRNNKIPIYISWGNITPKMVYLKDLNYKNSGSTDTDRINNGDYLINFGPCYFDELFRLNLIINDLNIGIQQVYTKDLINSINFTDTTLYYLIIEGDYYNNALRFFYNYANNLTIINLISESNQKNTTNFNLSNIPDHIVTDESSNIYKTYIDEIYNTKQTFEFNRPILNNISDQITNFPNVVLINIPSAENNNDLNNHNLGKAINKSFDIMKKHFNSLTDSQKSKSYIYIKTESYEGELGLINALNDSTNYEQGNTETLPLTSQSNKYFLSNSKVILSSYNNIEYTLKKYKKDNFSSSILLENCRILSSYNLNTNNEVVNYINNLQSTFYNSNIQDYEQKTSQSFTINTSDPYLSYQQINKALLESIIFFYISIIDITYNNNNNLKNTSTGSSVNFYKLTGEKLYEIYIKYLDLFLIEDSYVNSPIFDTLFDKLLSKYNSNINSQNNNYYRKYIETNQNWALGMSNILNQGLKNKNFRIRTFELYKFNNQDNFEYDYVNNLSVYTDCDNFESAISSVFYEYILLKNTLSVSSGTPFNLQNIFDDVNSILIKSDNLSDLMYYSPNLYFKFNNLTNVTLTLNSTQINNNSTTRDITNNLQVELINPDTSGSFTIVAEIQNVKNIYNNFNTFNLYSNTITINIQ